LKKKEPKMEQVHSHAATTGFLTLLILSLQHYFYVSHHLAEEVILWGQANPQEERQKGVV
jgi:hypothetical protein